MARRALIIIGAIILATGVAAGAYWRHYTHTPRYALQQMALALKAKDMDKFFNYLDLKEIINNFVAASSEDVQGPEDPKADDLNKMAQKMRKQFAKQLLPKLFEAFDQQIRGAVEQYLGKMTKAQILAAVAAVSVAKIEQQGDEARVTLVDPRSKEPFSFQMYRYPDNDTWKIIAINYEDAKKLAQRELNLR